MFTSRLIPLLGCNIFSFLHSYMSFSPRDEYQEVISEGNVFTSSPFRPYFSFSIRKSRVAFLRINFHNKERVANQLMYIRSVQQLVTSTKKYSMGTL
jgi:hypothetical protein